MNKNINTYINTNNEKKTIFQLEMLNGIRQRSPRNDRKIIIYFKNYFH